MHCCLPLSSSFLQGLQQKDSTVVRFFVMLIALRGRLVVHVGGLPVCLFLFCFYLFYFVLGCFFVLFFWWGGGGVALLCLFVCLFCLFFVCFVWLTALVLLSLHQRILPWSSCHCILHKIIRDAFLLISSRPGAKRHTLLVCVCVCVCVCVGFFVFFFFFFAIRRLHRKLERTACRSPKRL